MTGLRGQSSKSCFLIIIAAILALVFSSCQKEWKPGMPLPKEKVKIAVIYSNEINRNSFFDNAHYEGILEMQRAIGLEDAQIIHKANVFDGDPAMAEGIMRDCIAEGTNILIATSMGYMDTCEKLAAEFPGIFVFHATGYKFNNSNFTNFMIRLYQARYLSGIAAGMKTETGKIGFVAAMGKDSSEVTRGINAFAIGVEEVNPGAQVYVRVTHSWYDPMGETDAANALLAYGCDVIAAHGNTAMAQIAAQRAGAWSIGFNSDMSADAPGAVITSVVPRWGTVYTRFVEGIIAGTFKPMTYFYGLAEGAVDITALDEKLAAPGTEEVIRAARQRITGNGYNIFDGVLETNTGTFIGEEGKNLSDEIILGGIDWYYRNIVER